MGVGCNRFPAFLILTLAIMVGGYMSPPTRAESEPVVGDDLKPFFDLFSADREATRTAIGVIEQRWQDSYVSILLEVWRFTRNPDTVMGLVELLQKKTEQDLGYDRDGWYRWLWNREEQRFPYYATFKRTLYGYIDPKFEAYFEEQRPARIRLDEIVWGGVVQDGIPPLRSPKMVAPGEAGYLADDDVVFGLAINGDARAFPKRILAWHEMFVDDIGGVPVTGAYCTLCGSMILYNSQVGGTVHRMGTSGFLYRSNKLMYDEGTQSLWNTLWGTPVLGPLVEENIRLERLSVVTTTWGEWRRRHPDTTVLSIDTGHLRDYSEGAAYRQYFATDELMFEVPALDRRLKNKDQVLGLLFARYPDKPLAIAADYLSEHPVYHDRVGALQFVVLTDASGANRVYEAQDVVFNRWDGRDSVIDAAGETWQLTESGLSAANGRLLQRLPAHRAFWFGWYSAYSHSRLVH